jgi:hypothetical protein
MPSSSCFPLLSTLLRLCVFERLSTTMFNRVVAMFLLISGLALLARAF